MFPSTSTPRRSQVSGASLYGAISTSWLSGARSARSLCWRALRHPVLSLHAGIWARRDNLSAYDAAYLALADRLEAKLLTIDRALAAAASAEGRLAPVV